MSKRFNVTLPDAIFEELEWWAKSQGRPTANLANYLIEAGLRQAKERGEIPPKPLEEESEQKPPKKKPSSSRSLKEDK